jgi:hypothetical protein
MSARFTCRPIRPTNPQCVGNIEIFGLGFFWDTSQTLSAFSNELTSGSGAANGKDA